MGTPGRLWAAGSRSDRGFWGQSPQPRQAPGVQCSPAQRLPANCCPQVATLAACLYPPAPRSMRPQLTLRPCQALPWVARPAPWNGGSV